MDEPFNSDGLIPWPWLVGPCRWLWSKLRGLWSIIISGLLVTLLGILFFTPISQLAPLSESWAGQYKVPLLVGTGILFVLTIIIGLISGFPATPSMRVRKHRYLQQMLLDNESLSATGIPEIFFPPAIKLDKVFILPKFIYERTPIDYPMREEEILALQSKPSRSKKSLSKNPVDRVSPQEPFGIAELWQNLQHEYPAAVVQGYPGMGKSTFMQRLTAYMARCSLGIPDPHLPMLASRLVPLLIKLKEYADACKKASEVREDLPSISIYFQQTLQKRNWQKKDPWPFINHSLEHGTCLVLFDGLDEVSTEIRKQVVQAINTFILEQRNTPLKQKTFNRFIITSRVAGYSPEAFLDARHYRIAELTEEAMHTFLKDWYSATGKVDSTARTTEVEARMQQLHTALSQHGAVFRLAENPLLLTLMAAMQKYGINLPRERAELYDTITLTLLKNREISKGLEPIDEEEAIRRLGPLACEMQSTDNLADVETVNDSLRQTIKAERAKSRPAQTQLTDPATEQAEIEKLATDFLKRIRERSNLFVQRSGEDFGFFHRSFQEYFAARYILNTIQHKRKPKIARLVALARQTNDTWREPFLFAVAYQSLGRGRDKTVACDLLCKLLEECQKDSDPVHRFHDLLLAADAVIETKPLVIDQASEKYLAASLLPIYMQAQQQENFEDCQKIERAIRLWLLALSPEDSQSSLFLTLSDILRDVNNSARPSWLTPAKRTRAFR